MISPASVSISTDSSLVVFTDGWRFARSQIVREQTLAALTTHTVQEIPAHRHTHTQNIINTPESEHEMLNKCLNVRDPMRQSSYTIFFSCQSHDITIDLIYCSQRCFDGCVMTVMRFSLPAGHLFRWHLLSSYECNNLLWNVAVCTVLCNLKISPAQRRDWSLLPPSAIHFHESVLSN